MKFVYYLVRKGAQYRAYDAKFVPPKFIIEGNSVRDLYFTPFEILRQSGQGVNAYMTFIIPDNPYGANCIEVRKHNVYEVHE